MAVPNNQKDPGVTTGVFPEKLDHHLGRGRYRLSYIGPDERHSALSE